MKAMVLYAQSKPLVLSELPAPEPTPDEVLLQVLSCGVCRTDLHIVDGELKHPTLPLIPGHQIVGRVERTGSRVTRYAEGDLVGVPWLGQTCGHCNFCTGGQENLCEAAVFTGYTRNGGFAEYATASEQFCFRLAPDADSNHIAPLLCGGLIGYRAYRFLRDAELIGFYGFGSAAHILCQVAVYQGRSIFAFTRPGDLASQDFARSLGAAWAGGTDEAPPLRLDAAIIFAPAGNLVPLALKGVRPGGKVISAGIHMSDIPSFPYELLWQERSVQSVANLTRLDGEEFLQLAPTIPVKTEITLYSLRQTSQALDDLRSGKLNGAAVVTPTIS